MTRQVCSAFSVICWSAADFMSEVSCPRSTRPSGKMRCCCQISIAENYIVFDAKITPRNHMKKQNIITVYFHAFSSKANFESPLKTYQVIDNVEDVIVNMPK